VAAVVTLRSLDIPRPMDPGLRSIGPSCASSGATPAKDIPSSYGLACLVSTRVNCKAVARLTATHGVLCSVLAETVLYSSIITSQSSSSSSFIESHTHTHNTTIARQKRNTHSFDTYKQKAQKTATSPLPPLAFPLCSDAQTPGLRTLFTRSDQVNSILPYRFNPPT
jgi:hypothetical protein